MLFHLEYRYFEVLLKPSEFRQQKTPEIWGLSMTVLGVSKTDVLIMVLAVFTPKFSFHHFPAIITE